MMCIIIKHTSVLVKWFSRRILPAKRTLQWTTVQLGCVSTQMLASQLDVHNDYVRVPPTIWAVHTVKPLIPVLCATQNIRATINRHIIASIYSTTAHLWEHCSHGVLSKRQFRLIYEWQFKSCINKSGFNLLRTWFGCLIIINSFCINFLTNLHLLLFWCYVCSSHS